MASTKRRSLGLDSDPLRRLPPSPKNPLPAGRQFIKVVLDSTIETKMLRIPPRFVKSGPELSDIVILETPVGLKQKIQLKRVGEEVWFQDGWSEFAERHSISRGTMLLFDFQGDSIFRVHIFDLSATEVDYIRSNVIHIDDESDEEMKEGCKVEDEDWGDGFLGSQGIKQEEKDIIDLSDVSTENDVKTSNCRSSPYKRRREVKIRMPNSEPSKKTVARRNQGNRSKKTMSK